MWAWERERKAYQLWGERMREEGSTAVARRHQRNERLQKHAGCNTDQRSQAELAVGETAILLASPLHLY